MPIDSLRYSNASNRYADKYQSIAPESSSSRGSWMQTSSSSGASASLVNKQPFSALSADKQKQLHQTRLNKDTLENLPTHFPSSALPKTVYEPTINLMKKRIDNLESRPESKNPLTMLKHSREDKKLDKAINQHMGTLYKQARDVQLNGTNPTDRNRASNVTDQLTALGRTDAWFKDIRTENRKGGA